MTEGRFAELIGELMGAQASKEIIDRIWKDASPEVRKAIADEVLSKILFELNADDWIYKQHIQKLVTELLEGHRYEIIKRLDKRLDADLEDIVDKAFESAKVELTRNIRSTLERRY